MATGAVLLWIFQFAVGAAITFGLLAGCVVALAWTFATPPFARLRDGLTSYEVGKPATQRSHEYHLTAIGIGKDAQIELIASKEPKPRMPVLMSREETMYWIAAFHR